MSFVEKIRTTPGNLVYIVRGKDAGRPAWHYVLIDYKKLDAFKERLKTGSLDVSDYGRVLYSGWGENPPSHIVDEVREKYSD